MLNWFAVYVNVKHEKKVVQKLLEKGLEAYSPVVKKLQQWSDRKKWVEFPMISGYVFVKIDLKDKEKVLNCQGVFAFIKFNGAEAKIKELEILILKSIEASGYDVTQELPETKLNDLVEIVQGPLKGLTGTIVRIQNTDYLELALEGLNQTISVKVPKHTIKITDQLKNK